MTTTLPCCPSALSSTLNTITSTTGWTVTLVHTSASVYSQLCFHLLACTHKQFITMSYRANCPNIAVSLITNDVFTHSHSPGTVPLLPADPLSTSGWLCCPTSYVVQLLDWTLSLALPLLHRDYILTTTPLTMVVMTANPAGKKLVSSLGCSLHPWTSFSFTKIAHTRLVDINTTKTVPIVHELHVLADFTHAHTTSLFPFCSRLLPLNCTNFHLHVNSL